MGGKYELGDSMEWSISNTKAFIDVLYERVKKNQQQSSSFKGAVWEDINNKLATIIGMGDGVNRLKGKYQRLRTLHREFSTLLSRTGVTWDSTSNKVNAPPEVWDDLISKGKYYKHFKKNGIEFDYEMLGEIFNSSIATGKLSHASTQEPPTSDEEKQMEDDFLSKGVHHVGPIEVGDDDLEEIGDKKKHMGSSSERRRKEAKNSRIERLEEALSQWSELMSARTKSSKARTEALKAKAERYKAQASQTTSPISYPYSIDACMELLDSMEDISSKIYNNALVKFRDSDWRYMFIKMPSCRRKDWLGSLE